MNQVVTYAIELDVHGKEIDIKNKQQHFLEIQNIESYYNIRTVQDSFQIMTSYLALDDVVLFPLSNVKTSFQKSGFKTFKDKKVDTDIVSLRTIDNKRKFLTFNIIEDNYHRAQNLRALFDELLIDQPRFCNNGKIFSL